MAYECGVRYGVGTVLFGTGNRRHALAAGMVGSRTRGPANLRKIRWHPRMIALGYFGGHFSASAQGFVQHHVAPAMGIGP